MKKFGRLLICLDATEKDSLILQHLQLLKHNLEIKKSYFLHVIKKSILPNDIDQTFGASISQPDAAENNIKRLIKDELGDWLTDHKVIIERGNLVEKTLDAVKKYKIDLLVLSRNTDTELSYKTQKIASMANCSVLFIPHVPTDLYQKIVVPIDFSDNARRALNRALWQKKRNSSLQILPVHCYRVPSGYTKTGKSFQEFATIMRKNAEKEFELLITELKLPDITCEFFLVKNKKRIPRRIFEYTIRSKADFLIMGARGRTEFTSIFLGSNAIKLLDECSHLPVLMEKDETNINLLNKFLQ